MNSIALNKSFYNLINHFLISFFVIYTLVLFDTETLVLARTQNHNSRSKMNNQLPLSDVTNSSTIISSTMPRLNRSHRSSYVKSISIISKIQFRFAKTKIVSVLSNPDITNPGEVNFKLRLPKEAFITGLKMQVDGTGEIFTANITKIEDAMKMLETLKLHGKSHISYGWVQHRKSESSEIFDDFELKLVVGPEKSIKIMVAYQERLQRIHGTYDHTIHLIPEQLDKNTKIHIQVDINESDPIEAVNGTVLQLQSDEDDLVSVPNFCKGSDVKLNTKIDSATVVWNNYGDTEEDFICPHPSEGFTVSYSLETSNSGKILVHNGYFVHFFAPKNIRPLRKHVVFVVDVSDSMMGNKIYQLKSALVEILDELNIEDFFNIIAFSSDVEVYSHYKGDRANHLYPFPAYETYKDSARRFISKLSPNGSSNIDAALQKAFEVCRNTSDPRNLNSFKNRTRHQKTLKETIPLEVQSIILFLSDGEATSGVINPTAILARVKILNRNLSIPIFSLAFGEQADFPFLTKLSLKNNGFTRKVYENADASLQLANFYREISSPLLANMSFVYTFNGSWEYLVQDMTNSSPQMFFEGSETVIVGQFNDTPSKITTCKNVHLKATVFARGREGPVEYDVSNQCTPQATWRRGISSVDDESFEKLFAYLTIKRLLVEGKAGESKVCQQENNLPGKDNSDENYISSDEIYLIRANCSSLIRKRVTDLALQYGFVTPYTTLVMKTKSIYEEEMDTYGTNPGSDWEWFFGNELSLGESEKYSVKNHSKNIEKVSPELGTLRQNQTGYRVEQGETYTKVEIMKVNASTTATGKEPETISTSSPSLNLHNLSINKVTWLMNLNINRRKLLIPFPSNLEDIRVSLNLPVLPRFGNGIIERGNCSSAPDDTTECVALSECILPQFTQSIKIYLQWYICPFRTSEGVFLGVWCPSQSV